MSDVAIGSQYTPKSAAGEPLPSQKWDAIAVIEELCVFDRQMCEGTNPDLVDTS